MSPSIDRLEECVGGLAAHRQIEEMGVSGRWPVDVATRGGLQALWTSVVTGACRCVDKDDHLEAPLLSPC